MLIREVLYIIFCTIAGGAISAGYVAFITLLGVFEKLIEKAKSASSIRLTETLIIAGVSVGNIIYLFRPSLHLGFAGIFFYNLMGGLFTGCLAGALSETLNVFPIISRRTGIRTYLPYILYSAAIGKTLGSIIQLIFIRSNL